MRSSVAETRSGAAAQVASQTVSGAVAAEGWCPVCGRNVGAWEPGPNGRPNEQCPHCRSLKRNRLLVLALDRLSPLLDSTRVLMDVAPTPGVDNRLRDWVGEDSYISFDLGLDSRPVKVLGDLTKIPLPDDSVDVLVAFHVLEHVADDRAAMREIRRVIGEHGIAVLQVPWLRDRLTDEDPSVPREERVRRFGRHDHVRMYGSDWEDRLREEGLSISRFSAGAQLPAEVVRRVNVNGLLWFATGVTGDPEAPDRLIAAVLERRRQRDDRTVTTTSLGQELRNTRRRLRERETELRAAIAERDVAEAHAAQIANSHAYKVGRGITAPFRRTQRFISRHHRLRRVARYVRRWLAQ